MRRQEHTLNDEYENFVNAHLEVAAKYIPTKQRNKSRVPWETLAVREKCADVKTASKCTRKNSTNTNALKLKTAQNELANIYCSDTNAAYNQNPIERWMKGCILSFPQKSDLGLAKNY